MKANIQEWLTCISNSSHKLNNLKNLNTLEKLGKFIESVFILEAVNLKKAERPDLIRTDGTKMEKGEISVISPYFFKKYRLK